jgi:hypothetical protein
MHHFAGYLVKNQNGDVVQYAPQRAQAEQFCQQNGLPGSNITQIYEWKNIREFTPPPPTTPNDEPIDLQPIR